MNPWKVLGKLIAFTPGWFSGVTAFALFAFCAVPLAAGLATRVFFDAVAGNQTAFSVAGAIALIAAVQLSDVIAGLVGSHTIAVMQGRCHTLMHTNLFTSILRGFGRHGLVEPPSESISRFRDDPQNIVWGAMDALCDLIGRGLFALVGGYVMWRIDPTVTIALAVPLVVTSAVTNALGERTARYRLAEREATGRQTGFLGELLSAQLAVKAAGAIPHAIARTEEISEERRRASVRDSVFEKVLDSINLQFVHLGTGIVLLFGAARLRQGSLTVGDFALFVVFLDQLTYLPAEVGRMISELKRVRVSHGRMHDLVPGAEEEAIVRRSPIYLKGSPPPGPAPRASEDDRLRRLDVVGLTYRYPSSGQGVEDVSFSLERGSVTAITGRVGTGKTTLLLALLGLVTADEGEIRWNGRTVADPATFFVPPRTAYTPQVPRLFSETLRENVTLGSDGGPERLDAALRSAVLESDVLTLERGLDTVVGPRGVKLSGGQIQRTAAARMFVRDADLLVFDDLSSALDAETEAELWTRLFDRPDPESVTCLVVTHRPAALRRADQVIVLE